MDTHADNVRHVDDTDEDMLDPMDTLENDVDRTEGEVGKPGDGIGRREDVHGSGVYPASGPLPENDAPLVAPAGCGQGARGAEGYEDHGDSELHVEGVIGSEPVEDTLVEGDLIDATEIPVHDWVEFLEDFTERNIERLITIEVGDPDADEDDIDIIVDCLPLVGVSTDFKDDGEDGTIQVMAGDDTSDHITHTVTEPTFIYLYQDELGEDEALEIESGVNPTTFIRFE